MLKQTTALMGLLLSLSSHAEILDLGSITRDTGTGLDWLDVTETQGLSHNQVSAQFGAGGDYQGYRYATLAELDQLIINFGYTAVDSNCPYTSLHCDMLAHDDDSVLVEQMIRTLGDTYDAGLDELDHALDISATGAGFTYGILGTTFRSPGRFDLAIIYDGEEISRNGGDYHSDLSDFIETSYWNNDQATGDHTSLGLGSFLVAPSEVPLPAAGWLFITALAGLAANKRKPLR